jgi:curli production assembly/transport component CsgF
MSLRAVARGCLAAAFFTCVSSASASTIIYTPVNPAFGGSPLNSPYLLGVAGAINGYKDPTATSTADPAKLFTQQLQGQLLSALSTQITSVIFGPNAAQSGKIVFGDQTIAFVKGLESTQLTITNTSTGTVTNIAIPTLQTTTGAGGQ